MKVKSKIKYALKKQLLKAYKKVININSSNFDKSIFKILYSIYKI